MKIKEPCPWCDTNEDLLISSDFELGGPYFVICLMCQCQGPSADTKPEARTLWNRGEK
jgi:hypothetical protein